MSPDPRESERAALFREIRPGFEHLPPGVTRPRHQHFSAYATVILDGGYVQASYAGRVRLKAGDVLIQPTLDCHDSRSGRHGPALHLLRLAWRHDSGLGGVYRLPDIDSVIRAARRDDREASELLVELVSCAQPQRPLTEDWPDLLAAELTRPTPCRIGEWAQNAGFARETVARGFSKVFGVSPRSFAAEMRTREAWLRTVRGRESLALIAADLGFADQPHMTRAIRTLTGATPDAWRRRVPPEPMHVR